MAALRGSSQIVKNILWNTKRFRQFSASARIYSITGNANADKALNTMTGGKVEGWLMWYEDVVGQTGIIEAQNKVLKAENDLFNVQKERRKQQNAMQDIRQQLKQISVELDKVQRGDERYLRILTEEHNIMKEEARLSVQLQNYEKQERLLFAELSSAVRESHEKERARNDRTKYWSIIATVTGALIGGLGTFISNYLRMRELRGMVKDSTNEAKELRIDVSKVSDSVHKHHAHTLAFLQQLRSMHGIKTSDGEADIVEELKQVGDAKDADKSLEEITESIQKELQKHDTLLQHELGEMKKVIGISKAQESEGSVVYVGPELEGMLESHNKDIEWKIKMNALWTTTLVYGAFALTLPVLYALFRGG